MSTLKTLSTRKRSAVKRTTAVTPKSKLLKAIIKAIQEKKGEHIVSLDLRKIPEAAADFFIICEATSSTQVRAIAEHIDMQIKENCNEMPYRKEGLQTSQWALIDYVNIVVNIMQPAIRNFYQLEEMWNDATIQKYEQLIIDN